jgi:hypothetical protein
MKNNWFSNSFFSQALGPHQFTDNRQQSAILDKPKAQQRVAFGGIATGEGNLIRFGKI